MLTTHSVALASYPIHPPIQVHGNPTTKWRTTERAHTSAAGVKKSPYDHFQMTGPSTRERAEQEITGLVKGTFCVGCVSAALNDVPETPVILMTRWRKLSKELHYLPMGCSHITLPNVVLT